MAFSIPVRRGAAGILAVILLLSGLLAATSAAFADTTGQVTVTANVGEELILTLSTNSVDFGSVVPSVGSYIKDPAVTATVQSNVNWVLDHRATALEHEGGQHSLPPLQYADSGSSSFSDFPTTDTQVKNGEPTAGESHTFAYKITVPWTNTPPGQYSGTVTYTVHP